MCYKCKIISINTDTKHAVTLEIVYFRFSFSKIRLISNKKRNFYLNELLKIFW